MGWIKYDDVEPRRSKEREKELQEIAEYWQQVKEYVAQEVAAGNISKKLGDAIISLESDCPRTEYDDLVILAERKILREKEETIYL